MLHACDDGQHFHIHMNTHEHEVHGTHTHTKHVYSPTKNTHRWSVTASWMRQMLHTHSMASSSIRATPLHSIAQHWCSMGHAPFTVAAMHQWLRRCQKIYRQRNSVFYDAPPCLRDSLLDGREGTTTGGPL